MPQQSSPAVQVWRPGAQALEDTGSFGNGKPAHQVIFFPDQPRGWPGTYTLLAGFSVRGPLTVPFTCCACSVKKKTPPPGHVSPAERPSVADCSVSARPVRLQTLELPIKSANQCLGFRAFRPNEPRNAPSKPVNCPPNDWPAIMKGQPPITDNPAYPVTTRFRRLIALGISTSPPSSINGLRRMEPLDTGGSAE